MDRQEQGADQRQQRVTRTGAEWEELALKLLLLYPKDAVRIRESPWHEWRNTEALLAILRFENVNEAFDQIGIPFSAYGCNRIAKALRKFQRQHPSLSPEARNREYIHGRPSRNK